MAGVNDNLIPINERTNTEQREIVVKGGVASGIARRRKSICNKLLNKEITSEEARKELEANGLTDDKSELTFLMYDLLKTSKDRQSEKTADRLNAMKMLMEYADGESESTSETPIVNINIVDNGNYEKAMYDETN